jgi:ATP-dependent Lon protease
MKSFKKSDTLILKNILSEKKTNNMEDFLKEKTSYVREIIRNTIISIMRNKQYDIFSNSDISLGLNILNDLYENTRTIENKLDILQKIIDKLSMIICSFGTKHVEDLIFITFGTECNNEIEKTGAIKEKYALIKKYFHPIGYKIIHWKNQTSRTTKETIELCSNKSTDEILFIEQANMFECFDAEKSVQSFFQKLYGMRVIIQNEKARKTLVINGIVDDIQINCLDNEYINARLFKIRSRANTLAPNEKPVYEKLIECLRFKDILVCGDDDIYKKMIGVFTETNIIKNNNLDLTIRRFLEMDVYSQRNLLMNLLLNNLDFDVQYICYLLYDLISIQSFDNGDTREQIMIYDSLPWKMKEQFKDVIKHTIKRTNDMIQKYDINKISLEQQIYLLKTDDFIKEKAMIKLKEVKTKSDEMGMKAKQYLEGLIKIPFGIYREEPILKIMKELNIMFSKTASNYEKLMGITVHRKTNYTNTEIKYAIQKYNEMMPRKIIEFFKEDLNTCAKKTLDSIVNYINNVLKTEKKDKLKSRTKEKKLHAINNFLLTAKDKNSVALFDLLKTNVPVSLQKTIEDSHILIEKTENLEREITSIAGALEESIHGHKTAKNQILKIIAQWMNGEQTGYSFGFEGSPGIGKTSLARKGLANCLKDGNGESRPYHFIALGGSSNGKTLEGHGYTYVNSTWGKIVDILMDSKCMNPIIYIDELDKVSNTEEGKEIIGILIHLIDQSQNELFQDKYFSGINLDLSKALFIFSYNDANQIDKILLDRIHRIKFDNLSIEDKVIIVNKYILPEMNTRMGFDNIVNINEENIIFIIEEYTCEPGVRKLKEILFDLFGEINIEMLRCIGSPNMEIPINLTNDTIENKYLKKYRKINHTKINSESAIGVINGLWANALGAGGILIIETMFFPSDTFLDLKLTGMLGDVMKESMNVAKTLAWGQTDSANREIWMKKYQETRSLGLHINCTEGAISKDGPSAGSAITVAIYSLLNNKKIRNDIAITGEINLQGKITAIGGLSEKIRGAIKSGVKQILYPKENNKDFKEYCDLLRQQLPKNIIFTEVEKITEVFDIVFE